MTTEEKAFDIVQTLCLKGCKAYLTGGAVRDLFLGNEPKDYDIVTDATPEQLQRWFRNRQVNTVGVSFEVTIIDGIDVAGYRVDVYHDSGELSHTEPALTIEDDLSRRDFTFNSLAFCPYTNELLDFHGGKHDLDNKIIRFTGDPKKRITEDPCRIIRACRFFAKLGKDASFAQDTFEALQEFSYLVQMVAPERIRKELLEVMTYEAPYLFFDALNAINCLHFILPSVHACIGIVGGKYHCETVYQHLFLCGTAISRKYPLLRLAGYLHDVGKAVSMTTGDDGAVHFINHEVLGAAIAEQDLRDLMFSNTEIVFITGLIKEHMKPIISLTSKKSFRKLYKSLLDNGVHWKDFIRLRIADRKANLAKVPFTPAEIKTMVMSLYWVRKEPKRAFSVKDLAVNGHDIMRICNIPASPKIKEIQNFLLESVLEDPELNEYAQLVSLMKQYKNERM